MFNKNKRLWASWTPRLPISHHEQTKKVSKVLGAENVCGHWWFPKTEKRVNLGVFEFDVREPTITATLDGEELLMSEIQWSAFTWEAFATLTAGTFAVVGAVIVAFRQQKILSHQTTIERLKLRSDTFELRWAVYRATADWLLEWWKTGEQPKGETSDNYNWQMERSKFLFRPEVSVRLNQWDRLSRKQCMLKRSLDRVSEDQSAEIELEMHEIATTLENAFKELPVLFGNDMRMTEMQGNLPPLVPEERPVE